MPSGHIAVATVSLLPRQWHHSHASFQPHLLLSLVLPPCLWKSFPPSSQWSLHRNGGKVDGCDIEMDMQFSAMSIWYLNSSMERMRRLTTQNLFSYKWDVTYHERVFYVEAEGLEGADCHCSHCNSKTIISLMRSSMLSSSCPSAPWRSWMAHRSHWRSSYCFFSSCCCDRPSSSSSLDSPKELSWKCWYHVMLASPHFWRHVLSPSPLLWHVTSLSADVLAMWP